MGKFVEFIGSRRPRLRVHIVIDGNQPYARGYPAGNGSVIEVSDAEADVLIGKTPAVIKDNGKIVTGFYVDGDLGEAGLTGEGWRLYLDEPEVVTETPVLVEPVVEAPKARVSRFTPKVETETPVTPE